MVSNDQNVAICIPARFNSLRFPGKPLALINGIPLIVKVTQNMNQSQLASKVIVLTDHEAIFELVKSEGYDVIMTSSDHQNGTQRLLEFQAKEKFDYYINVQGDEPFVTHSEIDHFINHLKENSLDLLTPISSIQDKDLLFDYNIVKVVTNNKSEALYFSRQAIPGHRDLPYRDWFGAASYFRHIGIYGFSHDTLDIVRTMEDTEIEKSEKLEQLRWLYHGLTINCIKMEINNFGIDTPEQLEAVNKKFYLS